MEYLTRLSLSTAFALLVATSFTQAQESDTEEMQPGEMMEEHGMMGNGNMSGMMGMMEKMGPMMEACTEMMQAMNDKADAEKPAQQDG